MALNKAQCQWHTPAGCRRSAFQGDARCGLGSACGTSRNAPCLRSALIPPPRLFRTGWSFSSIPMRIISRQHDALTGAASCVRFVLRTGPARAGKAHGDMCDGIGPIGAYPRPAHASRGRSAGRPLSMGARKSRFCACPQHAVRCARDSGPSPIPCQVPGLKIKPLSRAHGRRTSCLRERRKPDFSRFG